MVSFSTGTRYKPLVCSQCLSAPSCQAGKLQGFSHINICEILLWCKGHFSACLSEGEPTAFKRVPQSLCTNSIVGVSQVWKSVLEKSSENKTNSEGCYCAVSGVWGGGGVGRVLSFFIFNMNINGKFMQTYSWKSRLEERAPGRTDKHFLKWNVALIFFLFWEVIQVTLTESRDTLWLGSLCAQCNGKAVQDQFICVKIWPLWVWRSMKPLLICLGHAGHCFRVALIYVLGFSTSRRIKYG